jgi:protein translocase SecG subunit
VNNLLILAQAESSSGMSGLQLLFGAVYIIICLSMIGSILMKTPKNDGLGGMMGGGSSDASFKGAKSKDDTIDTITNWIAIAFVAMSIGLNYVF